MPRFSSLRRSEKLRELRRQPRSTLYQICDTCHLDYDEGDRRYALAEIIERACIVNTDDRGFLYVQSRSSGLLHVIRVFDQGTHCSLVHDTIVPHQVRDFFSDHGLVGVVRSAY